MDINLDNFIVRKTEHYNAGPIGLAPGEERYISKAQGLVGFEIFAEDKISIKNIEGVEPREVIQNSYETADALVFFLPDENAAKKCREYLVADGLGTKILPEACLLYTSDAADE